VFFKNFTRKENLGQVQRLFSLLAKFCQKVKLIFFKSKKKKSDQRFSTLFLVYSQILLNLRKHDFCHFSTSSHGLFSLWLQTNIPKIK